MTTGIIGRNHPPPSPTTSGHQCRVPVCDSCCQILMRGAGPVLQGSSIIRNSHASGYWPIESGECSCTCSGPTRQPTDRPKTSDIHNDNEKNRHRPKRRSRYLSFSAHAAQESLGRCFACSKSYADSAAAGKSSIRRSSRTGTEAAGRKGQPRVHRTQNRPASAVPFQTRIGG
jgi:hypothetical protein